MLIIGFNSFYSINSRLLKLNENNYLFLIKFI